MTLPPRKLGITTKVARRGLRAPAKAAPALDPASERHPSPAGLRLCTADGARKYVTAS